MMEKPTVSRSELVDLLIQETGNRLGGGAQSLRNFLEVRKRRAPDPNWDATIETSPIAVRDAFAAALTIVKKKVNLADE